MWVLSLLFSDLHNLTSNQDTIDPLWTQWKRPVPQSTVGPGADLICRPRGSITINLILCGISKYKAIHHHPWALPIGRRQWSLDHCHDQGLYLGKSGYKSHWTKWISRSVGNRTTCNTVFESNDINTMVRQRGMVHLECIQVRQIWTRGVSPMALLGTSCELAYWHIDGPVSTVMRAIQD
jgi:hypothetical protein